MGDEVYHKLANVLDTLPNGFPATEDGIEITTDCTVCDLMINQSFILEIPTDFHVYLANHQPQAVPAELFKEQSFQFIYLRGPPSLG
jgi:hypothetical protein